MIVMILCLMGMAIVLLLLEIFLLPGVTIAVVGGVACAVAGVVLAYTVSPLWGHVTLAVSAAVFGGALWWLLRCPGVFRRMALEAQVDACLPAVDKLGIRPGDRGVTLSRLAPIGRAQIGEWTVEARSEGGFIDERCAVTVISVEGNNVTVKPVTE